ncbi:hypothetical protein [Solibacillus isronensis]|uniref:hypothetical protein n=2 Tax=Solibacillus TaxID=648800 RepID=UPI0039A2C068
MTAFNEALAEKERILNWNFEKEDENKFAEVKKEYDSLYAGDATLEYLSGLIERVRETEDNNEKVAIFHYLYTSDITRYDVDDYVKKMDPNEFPAFCSLIILIVKHDEIDSQYYLSNLTLAEKLIFEELQFKGSHCHPIKYLLGEEVSTVFEAENMFEIPPVYLKYANEKESYVAAKVKRTLEAEKYDESLEIVAGAGFEEYYRLFNVYDRTFIFPSDLAGYFRKMTTIMKEASERNLITPEEIIERISSFIIDRVDPCWGADHELTEELMESMKNSVLHMLTNTK